MPDIATLEAAAVVALEARQEAARRLNEACAPNISPGLRALPSAHARAGRLTVCAIAPLDRTGGQVQFQFCIDGRRLREPSPSQR
jgi:hypothetical protein